MHSPGRTVLRVMAVAFIAIIVLALAMVAGAAVAVPNCGLCHSSGAFGAATRSASHKSVPCKACHIDPGVVAQASFGFQQALHVAAPLHLTAATDVLSVVPDSRCLTCHEEVLNGQTTTSNGLSIRHKSCAATSKCVDCHSTVGHGTQSGWVTSYNMDMCLHCHGSDPQLSKCTLCHTGKSVTARIASGPWRVTHGANWRQAHGMGDLLTCSACHPKGYCDKCHGTGLPHPEDFRTLHPTYAKDPKARCTGLCHTNKFCTNCHGIQMPHPAGFLKVHEATAKLRGQDLCLRCHSQNDCTECHIRHIHPGGALGLSGKVGITQ